MLKIIVVTTLVLSTLTGCQTVAERKQSWIKDARSECASYGFSQNTPEMASCIQLTVQNKEQSNREYWQNMSEAFKGMTLQPSNSVNCTSSRFGNTINTRCN
jgi:(p)ppGpp synthase/HD superfamily hydrolase